MGPEKFQEIPGWWNIVILLCASSNLEGCLVSSGWLTWKLKLWNITIRPEGWTFFSQFDFKSHFFSKINQIFVKKKIPRSLRNPSTGRVPSLNQCVLRLYCDFARVFSLHGWVNLKVSCTKQLFLDMFGIYFKFPVVCVYICIYIYIYLYLYLYSIGVGISLVTLVLSRLWLSFCLACACSFGDVWHAWWSLLHDLWKRMCMYQKMWFVETAGREQTSSAIMHVCSGRAGGIEHGLHYRCGHV